MPVPKSERRTDSLHTYEPQTKKNSSGKKAIQKPQDSVPQGLPNFTLTPPYLIKIEKATTSSSKLDSTEKKAPPKKVKTKNKDNRTKNAANAAANLGTEVLDPKSGQKVLEALRQQQVLQLNSETEDDD